MPAVHASRAGWFPVAVVGLTLSVIGWTSKALVAQAGVQGQWRTLTNQAPINPIHVALLNTGKVLIVSGSGNVATETNFQAAVWDPLSQTFQTQAVAWDMFCNGMVVLPDGKVLINGGTLQYDPFFGERRSAVYDPATGLFTNVQSMAHGRWYPTVTTLGDGTVMTFSGLLDTGGTNTNVEIYTPGAGWTQEFPAGWTPPLYPRMHLNTDGRVFYAGSTRGSRFFTPSTRTWSTVIATTLFTGTRTYGTSVLLPLTPANSYRPRVMIMGGSNPATATTEIIDPSAPTPAWQSGPPMSQPRIQMSATILPTGRVLVMGGSTNDEDAATASLNADLFNPNTNTFTSAGANAHARLYHSGALLLPDATVLLIGGNPQRGNYEKRLEIYSPAYLFNSDGTAAFRPTITGITPGTVGYGAAFQVQTPDAAEIGSVVLVRPGSATHAFDMDQRLVGLTFTRGTGVLNVTAPPNANIAPPGYYMLFVLNTAGVPSAARFVRVTSTPPTGDFSIAVTPASRTIARGGIATYTVTVTSQGFAGTVNLSVTGAPNRATKSFNPSSIVNAGTSTLTIDTQNNVQRRTFTMTITGTGGGRTHSVTATLIVQ